MEQSTAPAIAQAPVASVTDIMSKVASQTKIEAPAVVAAEPTVRFTKELPLSIPSAAETPAPVAVAAPEGETAAVSAEPSGELSIDDGAIVIASQRNADGTFKTKLDPSEKIDLVIKSQIDPETGKPKVYSKTLPELARLAKDGIAMNQTVQRVQTELQTIQPEVEYYRTNLPKWQEHTSSLQEQLDAQKALNVELLSSDDEIVIQRREQYKAEMSPEKQLARMRAEKEAEQNTTREAARREQHNKIAQSFMGSRIAPALAKAETAGLSKYTVTGIVSEMTADLVGSNGVIPPAAWPEMERRINDPAGPFQSAVAAESAKRTQESATVTAAREAAEAEQKRAQSAVNEVGRQMAPVGRAGGDNPQQKKPGNVREAIDFINRRPTPA